MDLLAKVKAHKEKQHKLKWEGTFAEYLELLKQRPHLAQSAHARIYQMIEQSGINDVNGRKVYRFFENELFGIEETIERIIDEFLHPAAKRLDVKKRILLLVGPVSGGKSTIVTLLKKGLESYTYTDDGAVYAIKGCPMHEDPLHLIPEELRATFESSFGIRIEGQLSPLNKMRLEKEYNGQIENVQVERIFFSENNRMGIGTFAPSDPKSQDIADLTGSIDFSTIATFGSESDPRAYRFDGELNIANRGLLEFQEILKSDEKFLWHLLSLTQEGNFKAGRFALISADELIIAHTNEAEYRSFVSNKKNEALHSRMIVIPVPYNLKLRAEERIYQKMIETSDMKDVHITPHTLYTAAMFTILTRLKESKKSTITLVNKMYLYDGKVVDGFNEADLSLLKKEFLNEGMDGIDPRFVFNRISSIMIKKEIKTVNALDVLRCLKEGIETHLSLTKKQKEFYLECISMARKEYDKIAKREVQKAFISSYEDAAETIINNYLDNIEAFCNQKKVQDPLTGKDLQPNERLMRSIEEQIGVSENAKKAFREEILIRISTYARKGKSFNYQSHERLNEAIQKKLFADLKDVIKVTSVMYTREGQQSKQLAEVVAILKNKYGYSKDSANELLHYVGSLLNE
ncbi:PrkA family serine protein kinase [Paraliobacillus salinarum]|uniref:PrkA family serine protein kinase n=1 Tax=Paraliobacillus salinarum TaxID=1158996 RepID=UPI0015F590BD|nr:protein prkA [Paraliobacillus salinarum]